MQVSLATFLIRRNLASHPSSELIQVPCLDINRPRSREATYQPLTRLHRAHRAATSTLDIVVAVPSHQVAVVDNMLLALTEMLDLDRAVRGEPEDPFAAETENEEVFAAEQGFAETLGLGLSDDIGSVG